MNRSKVGEIISTIRKQIKALNKDAFITDRFIYSLVMKHAAWLLRREDSLNKLLRYISSFQSLDYVELIEIDKIEAGCTGLKSECTIMRTKERVPGMLHGYWGPIIRTISSIDGSEELDVTTPSAYIKIVNSKNYKYNKARYFWFLNGYIYFPDIEWEAVKIDGMFEDDISFYKCSDEDSCVPKQQRAFNVPAYLHAEIESHVMKDDLMVMFQIPGDPTHDKVNPAR